MSAVIYVVLASYLTIILYEARKTKGHCLNLPKKATWTLYLLFLTYVLAITGGLVEYHLAQEIELGISIVGIALIVVKVLLKAWAMRILGKYYNVHIVVSESHKLIRSGPYKYVRHPTYSARFLSIIGICLMLNAFWTLLMATVVDLIFVSIRIRAEEKELIEKFGEEYMTYKKQTWAIAPFRNLLTSRDMH